MVKGRLNLASTDRAWHCPEAVTLGADRTQRLGTPCGHRLGHSRWGLPAASSAHRRGRRALMPFQKWRRGWGLPQGPQKRCFSGAPEERGAEGSPGAAPEKRSQSALPPQGPWGRVGCGVGTWGVHSLTSSPSHPSQPCFQSWHWISQPQTQSLARETSVMGCTGSAPQKLGSWREASGSPLMASRRAPLTAALTFAARRERGRGGERGKGGSKGWMHGGG